MKIILINNGYGGTRTLTLSKWSALLLAFFAVAVPSLVFTLLSVFTPSSQTQIKLLTPDIQNVWSDTLNTQEQELLKAKQEAEAKLEALTLKAAELQARIVRLDALGERLTNIAKLDNGEFDFSEPPALGGPENAIAGHEQFDVPAFTLMMDDLANRIDNRQYQLEVLESLLANQKIQSDVFIAGRPITKGWMSSRYGRRNDPFTGKLAWHGGVDFAGKEGADIISVAAGVVTWSSERYGFGNLVEINHGNGYKTRYAHCKENLVKVGEVVKKGQVIALMGSSGRSTGPHVHFEVFKHGRPVDPSAYIHRTRR